MASRAQISAAYDAGLITVAERDRQYALTERGATPAQRVKIRLDVRGLNGVDEGQVEQRVEQSLAALAREVGATVVPGSVSVRL